MAECTRHRQAIEQAETTREQQMKTLFDIVLRQPDSASAEHVNALKETSQHEAVSIISANSRTVTEIKVSKLSKCAQYAHMKH